jgi:ABC-type branched-subunit amino acid transport system ATPase component/ABC-type branched-subunit amino acid transport system permease subunit
MKFESEKKPADRTARGRAFFAKYYVLGAKAVFVVAILILPLVSSSGLARSVMTSAGLYAVLTLGVALILGQAGQFSFGHATFYGIGAYTTGLLALRAHVPTLAAWVAGAAAAGAVALIVGRPVLKLKYFYLGLATIGLGQIFLVLVNQARGLTGGQGGLGGIPALSIFGLSFDSLRSQYYLIWVVALLILFFLQRALKGRPGRALRSLSVSELGASSLGVRTHNWKLLAFVGSAIICGIAGGLLVLTIGAISPNSFTFSVALFPMIMMLVGGGASLWACVVGAVLMTWLSNAFSGALQYSGLIYSVVLILLLLFLPAGLFGLLHGKRVTQLRMRLLPGSGLIDKLAPGGQASAEAELGVPWERPAVAAAKSADSRELLKVDGVSVNFGGLVAVDEVSLSVREGEIAAVIGPNGAGKTTLFNVITCVQKPAAGSVVFDGIEATKLSVANAARLGMARTFQNLRIFVNMTVLENVMVGRHRHERAGFFRAGLGLPGQKKEEAASREAAMEAIRLVGLEQQADLPAASLPYGRQRLVEIARALTTKPRLLLLDEPCAGMHAEERAYLMERIGRIRKSGIAVLVVEHNMELVMGISDRVWVLDHGKLIASGRPEEVQRDPAVLEAYLGAGCEEAGQASREPVVPGAGDSDAGAPLLSVDGLCVSYGAGQVLHDVSFQVPRGEMLTVLGANGAGKSTLLATIAGVLKPGKGEVSFEGARITGRPSDRLAAQGICLVPEGRHIFPDLSVQDNLLVAAPPRRKKPELKTDYDLVYTLFPILAERRRQPAGTLSGGEQQMVSIGRALMARPRLLLCDEPSMGLAPLVAEDIFAALSKLNREGLTLVMVEQNAVLASSISHRCLVLQNGNVVFRGTGSELGQDDLLRRLYLC